MITDQKEQIQEMKPIDNLTYKTFVKKFNEKYSASLLEEQKSLLSKYIASFSDNGIELKVYLNEEIPRLFKAVSESVNLPEINADREMLNKTDQVISMLKETAKRKVDKDFVYDILRIQNLVKEIS